MRPLHDRPPRLDRENFVTRDLQEYRLLLCDSKQWVKARLGDFEEKLFFVVETFCSEQEFRNAPIIARVDRQFRAYDIYGRRRNDHVELFANQRGEIPHGLRKHFESRNCLVRIRDWPADLEDSLPIILNNAIMGVVASTNKALDWAVVTAMQGHERPTVLPCSEAFFVQIVQALRSQSPAPEYTWYDVTVVALVRKNQVVWTCGIEALARHMLAATQNSRLDVVCAKDLEVECVSESKWEWEVPLCLPASVKACHEKPSQGMRNRVRKKKKLLQARQESINALEAESLDWLVLPSGRRISEAEFKTAKDYVKKVAQQRAAQKHA